RAATARVIAADVVTPAAPLRPQPALAMPTAPTVPTVPAAPATIEPLDDVIRRHIEYALAACKGRIDGPFGAARKLAINPHTLRARMRKLGIDWQRHRKAARPGTSPR